MSRRGTPRTCATRAAGSGRPSAASTSISPTPSSVSAQDVIQDRYGNLFEMYEKITGENPYDGADADLPGAALHHGRAVGRLLPDEQHPRALRAGRGQLLRSRRQPARRLRPDAGSRRRLLRHSLHPRRVPRRATAAMRSIIGDRSRSRHRGRRGQRIATSCCRSTARARSTRFHRELGMLMLDKCGMARTEEGLDRGHRPDPGAQGGVLDRRQGAGERRTSSTRSSRRPAGWPTTSSSPS